MQLHLPGTIESPSLDERLQAQGNYEEMRAIFAARLPMGRIGTPEEVAALVVYLASDESSFTTGVAHVIDGQLDQRLREDRQSRHARLRA